MTLDRGPDNGGDRVSFTMDEMAGLSAVKPTPYLDEADRIDPSWAIPEEKPEVLPPWTGGMMDFFRWRLGLDG